MKADTPANLKEFFSAAASCGFKVYPKVGRQQLSVISLDEPGPVLRYFAPDLRIRLDGTQIGGVLGLALQTGTTSGFAYDCDIFHNILNFRDLLRARRIIEDEVALGEFFSLLRTHLQDLPSSPGEIVSAVKSSDGWIWQQFAWNDPEVESFKRRLTMLQ